MNSTGPAKRYICTVSSPFFPREEHYYKTRDEMYIDVVLIIKELEKHYGDEIVEFTFTFREE